MKKVASLWAFLPTFRVVAELEHITKAAVALGISPSAVSRTISLLEAAIGHALFERAGRRISLNRAGAEMLAATRTAMRVVDDGLVIADNRRFAGPVRVAAVEPFVTCLAGATFERLKRRFPALVPTMTRPPESTIAQLVRTGAVDVAFARFPPTGAGLVVARLRAFETAVFAAVPASEGGRALLHVDVAISQQAASPWPIDEAREIAAVVSDYDAALHACVETSLAAVLPLAMVARHDAGRGLKRIDLTPTAPIILFAVTREVLVGQGPAELLVEAAREACAHLPEDPR